MREKTLLYPNLRAELSRNGLNTGELADYMGISRQSLYYKLKGAVQFNERDMKAVQEFFKAKGGGALTLDYIFKSNP